MAAISCSYFAASNERTAGFLRGQINRSRPSVVGGLKVGIPIAAFAFGLALP
jgi:hypothetical protein